MIKEAIEKVLQLNDDPVIEAERPDGIRMRYTKDGYSVIGVPMIETIPTTTLASFVEFCGLAENESLPDRPGLFVLVQADGAVALLGEPDPVTKKRPVYAGLQCPKPHRITGLSDEPSRWMSPESMIPDVMVAFEDTPDRAALLDVLGNVRAGKSITYADDGVTQAVTSRKGIDLDRKAELPSPLKLRPRASYSECTNPEQAYVFRA